MTRTALKLRALWLAGAGALLLGGAASACDLDGLAGPGHGGFGIWAGMATRRHATPPPDDPTGPARGRESRETLSGNAADAADRRGVRKESEKTPVARGAAGAR